MEMKNLSEFLEKHKNEDGTYNIDAAQADYNAYMAEFKADVEKTTATSVKGRYKKKIEELEKISATPAKDNEDKSEIQTLTELVNAQAKELADFKINSANEKIVTSALELGVPKATIDIVVSSGGDLSKVEWEQYVDTSIKKDVPPPKEDQENKKNDIESEQAAYAKSVLDRLFNK